MDEIKVVTIIIFSYLIGSIPTALMVSKWFHGFDIREKGSGNMGSTNVFRLLGWKWGLIVQIADILKGIIAVLMIVSIFGDGVTFPSISYFESETILKFIAGISAVCEHIWTIFAGFRDGKGINTSAGILIAIAPADVGIAVGIFMIAVVFSGYVSLGSILGALAFPSSIFVRYNIFRDYMPDYDILIGFSLLLAFLLILAHKKNIRRILNGTENKFSKLQIFKSRVKNT